MGKNVLGECKQLHYAQRPHSKVHVQSWSFFAYFEMSVQGHI
jgi:hypothetical protein